MPPYSQDSRRSARCDHVEADVGQGRRNSGATGEPELPPRDEDLLVEGYPTAGALAVTDDPGLQAA